MADGRGSAPRGSGPRGGRLRHPRRTSGRSRPTGATRARALARSAPRPRLTGRAAVLVLVVAALVMSYGSSLRAYLEQGRHIASLRAGIAESEAHIAALEREKARWDDDYYVISQARARFAFGFPGEIGYRVLDEDGEPLDHEDSLSDPKDMDESPPEWWETTLSSVEAAGNPTREAEPAEKIAPPTVKQDR
jgi:cell division protein FtsB